MPFDIYRALLAGVLGFLGTVFVLADYLIKGIPLLEVRYELLTGKLWLTLLIASVVATVVYFGLSFGASKLHKHLDKKREEKLHENF